MARRKYRPQQFLSARRVLYCALSPGGDQVAFSTDISGQLNLWRVPAGGGWPVQLTQFERESVRAVAWSPAGDRLAFLADPDGNEQYQVYVLPPGGWPERLTGRDDVQYVIGQSSFSPDGRCLAYNGNEQAPTDQDVFVHDLATGERRIVASGKSLYAGLWSPDGRSLLVLKWIANSNSEVYLAPADGGAPPQEVLPHPGQPAFMVPQCWRPDGDGFWFITDLGREFRGLAYCHAATGRWEYVLTPEWDVTAAAVSADGRRLACLVNEDGIDRLHVLDTATLAPLPAPALPPGVVTDLQFAAKNPDRLAVLMATARHPFDVYVVDLAAGTAAQVTFSSPVGVDPADLVEPELVRVPTWDARMVPAWLYRPPAVPADQPVPVLVSIHGGPEDQERPGYLGFYQCLLDDGIAVFAPNIRGSTGYGKTYQRLIYRDWGGGELRDIEACARWLRQQPWADPTRIGVFGGSFGGFATLSALTRLPEHWCCGVDVVGPANLATFAASVPPHWRHFMKEWVGDPEEDRELLLERSPVTYVDQLRAPLLILQGANDPRVVRAESDQMVERIRARGGDVEYVVFEDEGHGWAKRHNKDRAFHLMAEYLIRHLNPARAGAGS